MTFVQKIETETVFFLILGALVGYFFISQTRLNQQQFHTITNLPADAAVPTVTPTPFIPEISSTSQISSDGTKQVIVKSTPNSDQTTMYEVQTSDGDGTNTQTIVTKKLNAGESINIPFNTWSPDNRYFFLKEIKATGSAVSVYKGSGENFPSGEQSEDLTTAFNNRETGNTIEEATGWAGYNVIVINTFNKNQEKGLSYWFETPYGSIIPLSTRF